MSEQAGGRLRYRVPWDLIIGLGPSIAARKPAPAGDLLHRIFERLQPPPLYEGLENIPARPPFVLAANHYQRRHLWIVHAAAALSDPLRARFPEAPVRWLVTANWPPLRLGPLRIASPGDKLLPRVAETLGYFSIPYAATHPERAAAALRRLLRAAPQSIVGVFPEGARATAGTPGPPLPGIGRLFRHLALAGIPVLPARVGENGAQFLIRFAEPLTTTRILEAADPGELVMSAIAEA